ncbi:hypothetical protein FC70_GL000584 [Paucilactobacillus oligofermentans DSM 15707 = LMG 22743]|uniref:UPF0342 protein FC70_GL000584 n=2 Tax=Paucilactobacillus oligofermentans TaxID=293371 RepID=A0A0R1RGK9_9LACO|nr:hypothetical protein FC70_GL000584 [Paucilactobacillus oligofermentans DSM 15707 = LMG 22743]
MERDLSNTQEFAALKEAHAAMKADANAFSMFQDFQNMQMTLQQKQMQGQQPTEDEIKAAQDLAGKVGEIEVVKNLMEKEQAVDQMLSQINQVITKPIQELYQG